MSVDISSLRPYRTAVRQPPLGRVRAAAGRHLRVHAAEVRDHVDAGHRRKPALAGRPGAGAGH